ncbi:hypothetical protein BDV3_000182 [Batrachochytrium dendrobatidis]
MSRYEPVPIVDTTSGHAISIQDSPKWSSPNAFISKVSNSPATLGAIALSIFNPPNNNMPSRFVKLLGIPPPNSDGSITGPPVELNGGDERNHTMDVLDADNEDPFTLESLESLIHSHAKKGLDFIIARVTTVDPNNEERFYYSYYAAHHINKVLFRTQPEEGLLHRMRAKNPLNNMTIVGDVHYYAIPASAAIARMNDLDKLEAPQSPLGKVGTSIIKAIFPVDITKTASSTVRNHFSSRPDEASFVGDDSLLRFLESSGVNARQKKLHLIARPEAFESDASVISRSNYSIEKQENRTPKTTADKIKSKSHTRRESSRRNSFDDAYRDPLPAAITATTSNNTSNITTDLYQDSKSIAGPSSAHSGSPNTVDLNRHHNIRSFAFSNDHIGSMTVQDWVHQQSLLKAKLIQNNSQDITLAATTGSHSARMADKRTIYPSRLTQSAKSSPIGATMHSPVVEPFHPITPPLEFFYEATYYASDDDFLMKASVRSYFKENALEAGDAVLFTISTNTDSSEQATDQHPALLNFMYSVSESDNENRAMRNLDMNKLFKWMIVIYAIMAVVIVKFFVPVQFAFVVGFVLVFLFGLILIVCI